MNAIRNSSAIRDGDQTSAASRAVSVLLAAAIGEYQAGRLGEAKKLCLQILAADVRHADSLNLLGMIAYQTGALGVALKMVRRAIAIKSAEPAYHSNLGLVLEAAGYLDQAVAECRKALALRPTFVEAGVNLGHALHGQGRLENASECLERALALDPNCRQAHNNLGTVYLDQKKLDEARACFERALVLDPNYSEGYSNLGAVFKEMGDLKRARACLDRSLVLNPDNAAACNNLGNILKAQDNLEQAQACFERALSLECNPMYDCSLGAVLLERGELDGAQSCFERVLALKPDFAPAYRNLGLVLREQGRPEQAETFYRRALALDPDYDDARFGLGTTQLQRGEFQSGWANFEARWGAPGHDTRPRSYAQPRWKGELLQSGRVFLWGEQGIGDEIMFAGLVPDVLKGRNRVVLECEPRLQPLFARSFPSAEVVSTDPHQFVELYSRGIAAHLPTGSLPGLFRPSASSFAAVTSPYLKAEDSHREEFRSGYADGRKLIGLAWQTKAKVNGRKRSIDLPALSRLFVLPAIRWVSLQYGDFDALEQQAADADAPLLIDRRVDQFTDMDLFAAQVAALDMVITIDNSTAHLAGALGLPVWVLLPFAAEWRWQLGRTDSPWYPTLRLFRQSETCNWEPVIERVMSELSAPI